MVGVDGAARAVAANAATADVENRMMLFYLLHPYVAGGLMLLFLQLGRLVRLYSRSSRHESSGQLAVVRSRAEKQLVLVNHGIDRPSCSPDRWSVIAGDDAFGLEVPRFPSLVSLVTVW